MSGPKPRLHLPFADWPELDRQMWNAATQSDDPFDGGPGARLAKSTLYKYWMGWRRFLGFLAIVEPDVLEKKPFERLSRECVRQFVSRIYGRQIRIIRWRSRSTVSTVPRAR